MARMILLAVLLFSWGCGEGTQAGNPSAVAPSAVVDLAWVDERLGQEGLQLVDARAASDQFEAGHIPGAVRLDAYELSAIVDGVAGQVAPREVVAALIAESGLQPGGTIVVYGKPPEYDPARVMLVLRLYGYSDVRYLDGGWDAWNRAGLEVETGPSVVASPGRLPDGGGESFLVDGDWIVERLGPAPFGDSTIQLVDARSPAEYAAGRIPGAVHVQWTRHLSDGELLPLEELSELYEGLDKATTTVVYCLAGWRASHTWLVLNELGFEDVRVYDGSWIEWGQGGRFPIEYE